MGDSSGGLVAGVTILGIILLIVIILVALAVYFIIFKLKQHEKAVDDLDQRLQIVEIDVKTETESVADSASTSNMSSKRNTYEMEDTDPVEIRPKTTILVERQKASIYGNIPELNQVVQIVQESFQSQCANRVSVDDIDIVSSDKTSRHTSKILSADWKENRPSSVIFSEASRNEAETYDKGIFVQQMIGPSGGQLVLSGVTLMIPANAVQTNTLVTIGIILDERFSPPLRKKQALLSPVVLCQPCGTTFRLPVTLTFPHAAYNFMNDWNITILQRSGLLTEETSWEAKAYSCFPQRTILNSKVRLKLNHFSLYTCVGESNPGKQATKRVNVVAFSSSLTPGSFFKPNIYCLNDYKQDLAEVKEEVSQKSIPPKILEDTVLLVRDNDMDVVIEMTKCSEGWSVVGDTEEVVPFDLVWQKCHPHCMFVLRPKTEGVTEVVCEVHAYQYGSENKYSKLKLAEEVHTVQDTENKAEDEFVRVLSMMLEPLNEYGTNAGDWRTLADRMGMSLARIRWLSTKPCPVKILIGEWLNAGRTIKALLSLLREINRPDVVEELNKLLNNKTELKRVKHDDISSESIFLNNSKSGTNVNVSELKGDDGENKSDTFLKQHHQSRDALD